MNLYARSLAAILVASPLALPSRALAQSVDDASAIIELSNAIDNAVDAKDWDRAGAFFTDTISTDLPGQDGKASIPSSQLVQGWETNLHAEKASFHLRGSHRVEFADADNATVHSKAYAWNKVEGIVGGDLYEVWGNYTYDVTRGGDGWKVSGFAFEPVLQRGNMAVVEHQPDG